MSEINDEALSWDAEIEDGNENTLVEPGTYRFRVRNLVKGRYQPKTGGKLPPCPKAIITLVILDESANPIGRFDESLLLCRSLEWKVSAFFRSIGLKKHGERFVMDWSKVVDAEGRCEIEYRTWAKEDGTMGKANQVKKWLDPDAKDEEVIRNW